MNCLPFLKNFTGTLVHDHETALYHFGTGHGGDVGKYKTDIHGHTGYFLAGARLICSAGRLNCYEFYVDMEKQWCYNKFIQSTK